MLLALKKVQIIKITPPQVLTPSKKIPQAKFLIAPPPLFTAIWKTLHTVSFSLKFDPDIILIGCGLLPLSRLEYLSSYSYLNFLQCQTFFFDQKRTWNFQWYILKKEHVKSQSVS